jgi:hypothetical protein
MALLDFPQRQIAVKVVYFGAPGAGSNASVRSLYGLLASKERGRLHVFGPGEATEQSLFFDYQPPGALIPGFATRVRVYSLVSGIRHAGHCRAVLKNLDATVLVLDAREPPGDAVDRAQSELARHIREESLDPLRIPRALHVNHADASDAQSLESLVAALDRDAWGRAPAAAAVVEVHERLVAEIARRIRDNLAGDLSAIALVPTPADDPSHEDDIVAHHLAVIDASDRNSAPPLAIGVADLQLAMRNRYLALTPGPRIEVGFQPREFAGARPVHVLETRLDADQLVVDMVMERLSGGDPRRLSLVLANRPPDAAPVPRHTAPALQPRPAIADIPEKIELPEPEPWDFPPVWYGIAGLAAGVIVGVLIAVIVFM